MGKIAPLAYEATSVKLDTVADTLLCRRFQLARELNIQCDQGSMTGTDPHTSLRIDRSFCRTPGSRTNQHGKRVTFGLEITSRPAARRPSAARVQKGC